MEKKIFIIQFMDKDEAYNKYANTLDVAEQYLISKGYHITQPYDAEHNDAGVYEFDGDTFFTTSKARIISRNLLD